MKHFSQIVSRTLFTVNIILGLIMLFSAWSPWIIDPREHPLLSLAGFALPFFFVINLAFIALWLIFKWRYALFSLFIFICCQGQLKAYCPIRLKEKEIPSNALKIMSYNVMGFNKRFKDNTENKNPILAYIKAQNPDIICMQEFSFSKKNDPKNLTEEDIRGVLKDYPHYACLKTNSIRNGGTLLAVFSKFPILSSENISFANTSNGSSIHELLLGNDTVTLVNNHLESNKLTTADKVIYEEMIKNPEKETVSEGARILLKKLAEATSIRASQADTIARILSQKAHQSVIVCGDFNDIPVSYTHRVMQENLKDAYTEAGSGPGISYNQNKFYFRIDNILISKNLKALKSHVDRSISDSDHYPIWAFLVRENP